jgi:hypothetical protein
MNQQILKLMRQAGYAAPEIAGRANKLAELIIEDCIRTLHSNGYDDAAKCLQDLHFGIENPV